MTDDEAQYVCSACIGDGFLKAEIERADDRRLCMICDGTRAAIAFEELCDRVHGIVSADFVPTAGDPEHAWGTPWEPGIDRVRAGSDVDEVLYEILESGNELLDQVKERLSDLHHSFDAVMAGEEDPYGEEARYKARKPDDYELRDDWTLFQDEIRTQARFFSGTAEAVLGRIFGELRRFRTFDRPLVREAGPGTGTRHLFRGRRAFADDEIAAIVEHPARELGAPPARAAGSGRMNPRWISMFYGAFDPDTCVAELRAPVGSAVVIGRFDIVRPLRLLDLEALRHLYVDQPSYFDPGFRGLRDKAHFLKRLVDIMSRPVMPTDEDYQYLPTQAVAEYLSEKVEPRLDGLIFPSSQRGGRGENVVLFRRASAVEPDGTDGLRSETSFGWETDDDRDTDVTVRTERKAGEAEPAGGDRRDVASPGSNSGANPPTLRVDLANIEIRDVRAIEYAVERRRVRRHARSVRDRDDA